MKTLYLSIICILFGTALFAQDYTQTIRGKVTDQDTKQALISVNVVIPDRENFTGTTTDMDGSFRLENIPVGRVTLRFSFIGYKPVELQNLDLTTGKELVLEIEMTESVSQLNEVTIKATEGGDRVLNEMATVSARSFSVEESQRFAGARNDVSRMASNFAGVNTANDAVNDIVVRGNSPLGVLWRLEGIDIFNPNHFGAAGVTGGPVSMLNNNTLSNSDFLTGAFPAMYGNSTSGVFDLHMRNGNNENHEFMGQIGFNGFELGAEGPLNKEKGSSYIANYRYSVLGLMDEIGLNPGTGVGVPKYQDISMRFNFPNTKLGHISLFAIGGQNSIDFKNSGTAVEDLEDDFYTDGDEDLYNSNYMGVVGATQTLSWSDKTYSKLIVSAQIAQNNVEIDSLAGDQRAPTPQYRSGDRQEKLSGHFYVNHKRDATNVFRAGVMADFNRVNLRDSVFLASENGFRTLTDEQGNAPLLRAYGQWKHSFSDELVLNLGLYSQHFTLNGATSFEPRAGLKWEFKPRHTLSAGYGLHSQLAPLGVYFRETRLNGGYVQTNTQLDFQRSQHVVLGYGYQFENGLEFKAETYLQSIDRVPVEESASSYSLLNAGSFGTEIRDSLQNGGSGRNIGIDLTLQKPFARGNYFIVNASLYDSKYEGSDGVERNTAFNGNFLVNAVAGKEWKISGDAAKNKKTINADLKLTAAGGQRYSDIDAAASMEAQNTVLDDSNPYSNQFKTYFRADIRIGYKVHFKKLSQEWAIDVQNVTDNQNPLAVTYDWRTGSERIINQLGIFPMLQYRITF
ncbi:MAG: carboxypeptidase-like regulatory domain-containing protein [Cryomorphaceae bacterium]